MEQHRYMQVNQTLLSNANMNESDAVEIKVDNPTKGVENIPLFVTAGTLIGGLDYNEYIAECLEMSKSVEIDGILAQTSNYYEIAEETMKEMVRYIFEKNDIAAFSGRAFIGTGVSYGMDVGLAGLTGGTNITSVDAVSSAVTFVILFVVDLYRWSNDDITLEQLGVNTGEHVLGVSAQMGGSLLGALVGVNIGLVAGVVTFPFVVMPVVLFAILGGFGADLLVRTCYRKAIQWWKKRKFLEEIAVLEKNASNELGINLETMSFKEAHRVFRKQQIATHPDKHNNSPDSNLQFMAVIANWMVIREHYARAGKLYDDNNGASIEIRIAIYAMMVWRKGTWELVRTWFGKKTNAPVNDLPLTPPKHNEPHEFVRLRYIYL